MLAPRVAYHLEASDAVDPFRERIQESGPDLTRHQVRRLLENGVVQGDGSRWVTVHEGSRVRLIVEGSEPGSRARSSSPWVWAMGGGGV